MVSDRLKHLLHRIEWHRVILDESHSIKNRNCGQSKSVAELRATNRWCLTGTPFGTKVVDIENQLRFIGLRSEDIVKMELMKVSNSKVFQGGHSRNGRKQHLTVSELKQSDQRRAMPLMNAMERIMMRHQKEQLFNGRPIVAMPLKTESVILIDFTSIQRVCPMVHC